MRALLSAVLWVVAFSATAQSIYDNLQTQPLVSDTVYNYNVSVSHPANLWHVFDPDMDGQVSESVWLAAPAKLEELCKADLGDHTGHGVAVTTYTGNHRTDPRYFDFQCQGTWTSSDGEDSGSLSSTHLLFAYSTTVAQVCDANSQLVNGNCYLVADILSNDTCPTGGADILPINGADMSNGFVCQNKQDGSSCKYVMDSSNEFLVSDPEGTACYVDPNVNLWSDTGLTQPTSPTGQCQNIGGGVTACPEDPLNVCPNGQCQSGCGNVTWGGQTQFMCLSDDTDGDGIGDYADPDIDGDGIPNNQDPDADGDGQDDPQYNTGDGNGTTNVTVNVDPNAIGNAVGARVGQELENRLISQQDFSGSNTVTALEADATEAESKIDTLLNDSNFDLQNQVSESNLLTGLESATNAIVPTGCSASFTVPLTDKSIDLCEAMNKAKPFLYVLFAFGAFVYCWTRISTTVRSTV